jgi:hypothetical protein
MKLQVCLLLLAASAWAGPVQVTVEQKTHPCIVADYRDDGSPRAMYHKPETIRTNDITFPLITLNNGAVEIKIIPTLGMRVLNAVDLKSGQSFAGTADPRRFETEPFQDTLAFNAGFTEASFPYFEHGVGVRQSAGWRFITNADASVTVAMNMRFTHHQEPRHMGRYGRYSQAHLSQWLTLKPDADSYTVTYRLDNPTPLRRSNRLWVNHIFYTDKYDEQHILYPTGFVIPHNGQTVAPFYAAGGNLQWVNVSHFALYPEYGFSGIYVPDRKVNTVIFQDTKIAPGMKLYTQKADSGKMEIWHGTTPVFEDPGHFLAPFEPVQFTLTYRMIAGDRYWEGVKDFADTRDRLATVKPLGGKFRMELEEITNHIGAPTDRDAIGVARKGKPADPELAQSLANVCYRYGHFDLALQMTDDDFLRGLIAWERGEEVDFGKAGLDAHYHRALLALQAGKKDDAVKLLDELIAARPTVYRPRLLTAYLAKDVGLAGTLATENPASPEAQLVLELLGQPSARAALLRDNPEAAEQVEAFRRELTEGQWQYVRRYNPLLPKAGTK